MMQEANEKSIVLPPFLIISRWAFLGQNLSRYDIFLFSIFALPPLSLAQRTLSLTRRPLSLSPSHGWIPSTPSPSPSPASPPCRLAPTTRAPFFSRTRASQVLTTTHNRYQSSDFYPPATSFWRPWRSICSRRR